MFVTFDKQLNRQKNIFARVFIYLRTSKNAKMKAARLILFPLLAAALVVSCMPERNFSLPEGVVMDTYTYAVKGADTLKLDFYRDTTRSGALPTFMFSFGGGWCTGERAPVLWAGRFAKQGWNFVSIDYRKSIKDDEALRDSLNFKENYGGALNVAIEDLFDATAWLVSHASCLGVDPSRIVTSGSSCGAINSVTAEWMICNGAPLAVAHLPEGFNYSAVVSMAGALWKEGDDLPEWASQPCPHMFLHGTVDEVVEYDRMYIPQCDYSGFGPGALCALFKENKWPYELFSVEESDHYQCYGPDVHAFIPCDPTDYTRHIFDFLERIEGERMPLEIEWTEKTLDAPRTMETAVKNAKKSILKRSLRRQIGAPRIYGSGDLNAVVKQTYDFAVKDGDTLRLDVYRDPAAEGPRPTVLYSFGGGWEGGFKEMMGCKVYPFGQDLAAKGYTVVVPDYRLEYRKARNEGIVPDVGVVQYIMNENSSDSIAFGEVLKSVRIAVEDMYDATSYTVENAALLGVDPEKIIISGGSAGAFNALAAEYWLCNSDPMALERLPSGFRYAGVIPCAGAIWHPKDEPMEWKQAPAPMLLFHGNADQAVPYGTKIFEEVGLACSGASEIVKDLEKMGCTFMFYTGEGGDHEFSSNPTSYMDEIIAAFIDRCCLNGDHIQAKAVERWDPDKVEINTSVMYLRHADKYPFREVVNEFLKYIQHAWD